MKVSATMSAARSGRSFGEPHRRGSAPSRRRRSPRSEPDRSFRSDGHDRRREAEISTPSTGGGFDPAYTGACLNPNPLDYDCGGETGDGPLYAYATVRILGYDHSGLDGDGDGYGCE